MELKIIKTNDKKKNELIKKKANMIRITVISK